MSPDPLPPSFAKRSLAGVLLPDLAIGLGLVLSVLAVYLQTAFFDYINYDDGLYTYLNHFVQSGLTAASLRWLPTAVVSSNWHPVTMLSFLLDTSLVGSQPGVHHMVNAMFHAGSSVLLFMLLLRATRRRWPSAFVAFLFAVHPLHAESVAWISERKDVLSTFFLFLALYAYVRYAERPGWRSYLAVLALFALGLMSKPMLVTFPFVLLLFDFWPLQRFEAGWSACRRLALEKLPMFALSAVMSVVAYLVQRNTGAMTEAIPLAGKVGKAALSYVTYLRQTFWPAGLGVFYPYPRFVLASRIALAMLILLAISALAITWRRTRPYLATGWFWYLGTLFPVIGLVKVGEQSHADRYMYIPMVGVLIILAWGAAEAAGAWPRFKPAIAAAGVLSGLVCMGLAFNQVRYWRNSETLYVHTIALTGDNWVLEGNLGQYLMNIPDRRDEAMEHLQKALRIRPDDAEAENNLGLCLAHLELCGIAIPHFEAALRARPGLTAARNNLGFCLAHIGSYGPAIVQLDAVVRAQPDFANAWFNLGLALSNLPGREEDAITAYESGLRFWPDPTSAVIAHRLLGQLLAKRGRTQEAIAHLEAAEQIQPDVDTAKALDNLRAGRQ